MVKVRVFKAMLQGSVGLQDEVKAEGNEGNARSISGNFLSAREEERPGLGSVKHR